MRSWYRLQSVSLITGLLTGVGVRLVAAFSTSYPLHEKVLLSITMAMVATVLYEIRERLFASLARRIRR